MSAQTSSPAADAAHSAECGQHDVLLLGMRTVDTWAYEVRRARRRPQVSECRRGRAGRDSASGTRLLGHEPKRYRHDQAWEPARQSRPVSRPSRPLSPGQPAVLSFFLPLPSAHALERDPSILPQLPPGTLLFPISIADRPPERDVLRLTTRPTR